MAKKVIKKDVHAGGRPEKYDKDFYATILKEYETMSYSQLAKKHKISLSTALRWVKKGREMNGKK